MFLIPAVLAAAPVMDTAIATATSELGEGASTTVVTQLGAMAPYIGIGLVAVIGFFFAIRVLRRGLHV